MTADQLTPASVLGPQGRIAQRLKQYEHRPEQLQMADDVARAIAAYPVRTCEPGTGVGKSFPYLVPPILAATAGQGERPRPPEDGGEPQPRQRKRVVISTHTISLQEQLVGRDIPFLNAV